jgi:tetratricopeptide (TPR) repeat protein
VAIILVGLIAYFPVLRDGFVWDDDVLLTRNPLIKASNGLARFWATTQAPDYWPVTSTTLWLEWRLWGMNPLGYHATNLILHLGESLLLWYILRQVRLPGAFLAALIFAVHPVNVESVVWIAQRKNLMAMLFCLASLVCFLRTGLVTPAPGRAERSAGAVRPAWYRLCLAAFALAMLSKTSAAILPVIFMGMIALNRRVSRTDWARLAPFLAVAALLTLAEVWFQAHALSEPIRRATFAERCQGAGLALFFYLGKAFWPQHLAFVYPLWRTEADRLVGWLPVAAAAAVTGALWCYRKQGSRPLLFAWSYFCLALLPALGFVDVHFMRYSLVADHYQHLAIIGAAAATAAGWSRWRETQGTERLVGFDLPTITALAVLCPLVALTRWQCETYRDAETLYRSTLARNPDAWLAHNNLGDILHRQGKLPEATREFEAALRLAPDYAEAHNNLGNILRQTGHVPEAIAQFESAARLDPNSAETHNNLGNLLLQSRRLAEAIGQYREALRVNPAYAEARNGLGNALLRSGHPSEAIDEYVAAVRIRPDYANAHFDLGAALLERGRWAEAAAEFRAVLKITPEDAEARRYLRQSEFDLQLNSTEGGR